MSRHRRVRADPRPRSRSAPQHRGDIEGLRGVAVLLVVAFHAGLPFVPGGYVGVDVFFVLSGFLITGLLVDELQRSGSISLVGFYARRARRLLPLSAVVLVSTVVVAYLVLPPLDRAGTGRDVAAAALGVANWQFATESTQYAADTSRSAVLHYWSLGVEEQFYLVWPLLLILVAGRGLARRSWRVANRRIGVGLLVLGGVSFVVSWAVGGDGTFAYYGLHTRAWELAAGAGLAVLRPQLHRVPPTLAAAGGYLGLLAVVLSALVMDEETPFPGTAALVPVLGTVLLVLCGARAYGSPVPRLLRTGWLRFVGRISYAWYLWHWPSLVLTRAQWGREVQGADVVGDAPPAGTLSVPMTLAAVAASFGLAAVSHWVVENPVRTSALLQRSRRLTMSVASVLVAVSLASGAALWLPDPPDAAVATGFGLDVPSAPPTSASRTPSPTTATAEVRRALPTPASTPMTMAQARRDLPPGLDGCYSGYAALSAPPPSRCRLGVVNGSRTIALVGDSHAAQWLPAFAAAAENRGWTLYYLAKTACSVIDAPGWIAKVKGRYEACEQWRDSLVQRLNSIDGLDAVYLGRWSRYRTLTLGPTGEIVDPDDQGAIWQAGTSRLLRALPDLPKLVILRDTPWPDGDVVACLSKNPDDPARCTFPRKGHVGRDEGLVAAEEAGGGDRVEHLDLTPYVCPGNPCDVTTRDGVVVYRDGNHLGATFSQRIWQPVAEQVAATLR